MIFMNRNPRTSRSETVQGPIGFGPWTPVHEFVIKVYWPETKGHPIVYDQFQLELIEERNVKNIYKVRKIELRTENETREIDQVRLSLFCDSLFMSKKI